MAEIFDDRNPTVKWCLQRVFDETRIKLIDHRYREPVIRDKPGLYYSASKPSYVKTFEEYLPVPFNLVEILENAHRERKRSEIRQNQLKLLSKELYDRLRLLFPHRQKVQWERDVNYDEIISDLEKSLFSAIENYRLPLPGGYNKWKEKNNRDCYLSY